MSTKHVAFYLWPNEVQRVTSSKPASCVPSSPPLLLLPPLTIWCDYISWFVTLIFGMHQVNASISHNVCARTTTSSFNNPCENKFVIRKSICEQFSPTRNAKNFGLCEQIKRINAHTIAFLTETIMEKGVIEMNNLKSKLFATASSECVYRTRTSHSKPFSHAHRIVLMCVFCARWLAHAICHLRQYFHASKAHITRATKFIKTIVNIKYYRCQDAILIYYTAAVFNRSLQTVWTPCVCCVRLCFFSPLAFRCTTCTTLHFSLSKPFNWYTDWPHKRGIITDMHIKIFTTNCQII